MRPLGLLIAVSALLSFCNAKDEMQVEEFVKRHLNSLGTEQARSAARNRAVQGTQQFHMQHQGGTADGKAVFVSEGNKLVSLLKIPSSGYHGERFVSDGKRTEVATMKPGAYSELGQFVNSHNEIFTTGLWGGTLSTGWPISDLQGHHVSIQYVGRKKIDGRELQQFRYMPAKRSDLEIRLFFDPETGRHEMTTYDLTIAPQLAATEEENAKQKSTTYSIEERFGDYKQSDGLWLPGRWDIRFTLDVPGDPAHPQDIARAARFDTWEFAVSVTSISHNVTLDPKNFEVK